MALSENLIADFESFRSTPYWDVNAYRTGFGSDTVTRSDGSIVPVTQDVTVTREDAQRDLTRRVGEFQSGIVRDIGRVAWDNMNENQKAALSSVAYNYGSLPDRVTSVIAAGGDVAAAIAGLGGDNAGINSGRRNREASIFSGGDFEVADASGNIQQLLSLSQSGNLSPEIQAQVDEALAAQQAISAATDEVETQEAIAGGNQLESTILDAYMAGNLSPENMAGIDAAVASGQIALPDAPRTAGDELLRQAGLTARAGAQGVAGLLGIAADPIAATLNLFLNEEMEIQPLRENVSQLLTEAGVPEPETMTERIVGTAAEALTGGGASVGVARGVQGLTSGAPVASEVARQMAAQPAAQIVGAGTGGASSQASAEAGQGPIAQTVAGLAGGFGGAAAANRAAGVVDAAETAIRTGTAPSTARSVALADDVATAKRAGIDPMTSDVIPPQSFAARWLQGIGEKVPFAGTGPVRVKQQAQRQEAIRRVLKDFGADDVAGLTDDVMDDLAKTRTAAIAKNATAKNEVIDTVKGIVPVGKTQALIDKEIANLASLKTKGSDPVIAMLRDFRSAIDDQDLPNIEALRKQLGEAFNAPDMASVKSQGDKIVNRLYGSLNDDMGAFIKANGDRTDFTKWKVANKNLSGMADELKKSALKSVLKSGDATPEQVRTMLFSSKPSDVRALYKNLSPAGRKKAQGAVLGEAAARASGIKNPTSNELALAMENISPEKFKSNLVKLGGPIGVFFSGDDLGQVEGLVRALNLTRRAGSANVAPATGAQNILPVVGAALADMLGSFGGAITGGAAIGGSARAYESAPVRNAMIALSRVAPDSPEEAKIMKRLVAAIQTQNKEPE